MSKFTLTVQNGRFPGSEDYPSKDASGIEKCLCTNTQEIRKTMRNREVLANEISLQLTSKILDHLGNLDTLMGYPIIKED